MSPSIVAVTVPVPSVEPDCKIIEATPLESVKAVPLAGFSWPTPPLKEKVTKTPVEGLPPLVNVACKVPGLAPLTLLVGLPDESTKAKLRLIKLSKKHLHWVSFYFGLSLLL